jgi:hypothetical protein
LDSVRQAYPVNTLNGFMQEICPIGRPVKQESKALAKAGPGS